MDTISSNGSVTFAIDGLNLVGNTSLLYFVTSSTMQATIQNIATGSWQPVATTSSIADIRYVYVNNNGSGSVQIATDLAGTKVAAIMQPGDWVFMPWSGSGYVYARAYSSSSLLTSIVAAA